MSTFSKLSAVAQYDDLCRVVNRVLQDSGDEEESMLSILDCLKARWNTRESAHERDKEDLKEKITSLQREIKKLNRQLAESRTALVREVEEKKLVARERKALLDQIRQVRKLVESKDGLSNTDAHRNRIIKSLDVERLSPIQSDDSEDCISGLDYDRTEEDILDNDRSRRSAANFDEVLESLPNDEQPTQLLGRYYDKGLGNDNNDQLEHEERRRSSHRAAALAAQQRISSSNHHHHRSSHGASNGLESRATSNSKNKDKYADIGMDTDSNGMETDDNQIEYVRQQLQKYEADKKAEQLAAANSTPNVRIQNKAATLSAKSAANMMKTSSTVSTPAPTQKLHNFTAKKSFKPDSCGPCGNKISFYGSVYKCEHCGVICHPECRDKCPLPCVKIMAPNTRSRSKMIIISDYVTSDANPKVPALIVHCCNEIERGDNILTQGLYMVASRTSEIEDLQQKILKSKTGMPNLSKVSVHLLTGVVKRFLQGLDESLITTTLWSHFSEAIKMETDVEARSTMCFFIDYDLPVANRETLAYLMQHLHAIAKYSDKNLMTTSSLAKTLAPTIIGNSCRNPPPSTIQQENKIQIKIMETLFEIDEEYWGKYVHRSSTPIVTSLGSRLLGTPSSTAGGKTRTSARLAGTLPTPKLKPLFS